MDISDFSSTDEVDSFLEEKLGRKLNIKDIESGVVPSRGNVFKVGSCDINKMFDKMLGTE